MSSKDKLFALINATNPLPRPLTANNVELTDLRVSIGATWNTRVTILALPDQGYSRAQDVFYKRIDLAELDPVVYKAEEITSLALLLEALNLRRGTWMELEDVQPVAIPAVPQGGQSTLVLQAAEESFCFTGQVTITLKRAAVTPAAAVVTGALTDNVGNVDFPKLQRFTVSLSQSTTHAVTLGIRTVDGTAIADDDYLPAIELLQFSPGELTKTLDVPVKPNTSAGPKSFSVLLSDASGATIGTATATATYQPLALPEIWLSVSELVDGAYTLTVHRDAYPDTSNFHLSTVDGSAAAGDGYFAAIDYLDQFAAGETEKTVPIAILANMPGQELMFSVQVTEPVRAVLGEPASLMLAVPAGAVEPAVLSVGDAALELIGDGGAIAFAVSPAVVFNTVALPLRGPIASEAQVWEERPGVGVTFILDRVLVWGEKLELYRKSAVGDAYALVQTGGLAFDPGAMSGYITDPTYNTEGPSYSLDTDAEVYYQMIVRDANDVALATSGEIRLDLLAENPVAVEMFLDTFSGEGSLNGHQPDVNVLAQYSWPTGDGSFPYSWSANGTDPVTMRTGGRLVMGSSGEAPIILEPGTYVGTGDAIDPIPQAHVGSFTTTFVWRSPRSAAQDRLLTDNGYPLQLSVGKSDVTLAVDEYRTTIGFTISGNDGVTAKTLEFYGEPPVAVDYAADTDYVGTLVVEPGKRTLDFLGVHLETDVDLETESKRDLIIGPFYLHMGENCQLDDLRIVTGRHYAAV